MAKSRRFTYGDQFTPDKVALSELLQLCQSLQPDRFALQGAIRASYFEGHGSDPSQRDQNSNTMAMNCLLSLKGYGLIEVTDNGKSYAVTELTENLIALRDSPENLYRKFAVFILTKREGIFLCRLIENIRARGEQVTLEYLGEEMNEIGIKIPPNSTYISTMKSWLARAKVMRASGYHVNWDVIYDLLNVDADLIDNLYRLPAEQKYFLTSLVNLDVRDFAPSNKIAEHTRSVYKVRLTTKNLVKDVLEPLEQLELIQTQKVTSGRGSKPHLVRLTPKVQVEILGPLLEKLASVTELTSSEINLPFENVVAELASDNKHVKGKALEIFAVWIIRLLGLRFSHWRLRSYEATGGGEVDVIAASDKIVYSRWQIQCKNMKSTVDVDVIAKEVGLTFLTKADVVMVITTGKFSADAVNYANLVSDNSRYYVILLEYEDIERIVEDKTRIVEILNYKARRTFARRELGMTDLGDELIEEQPETEDEIETLLSESSQNEEDSSE